MGAGQCKKQTEKQRVNLPDSIFLRLLDVDSQQPSEFSWGKYSNWAISHCPKKAADVD